MAIFSKIFGNKTDRLLKEYEPKIHEINSLEKEYEAFSDEGLREKTQELTEQLRSGEKEEYVLPHAFALAREAAKRTLGQRHYDVQLLGGFILSENKIAEMKTGEGKTLVATLPVVLRALSKKGVHVVTVNDYLARRDTVWMGQVYAFLGLSVGVINHNSSYVYDRTVKSEQKDEERDDSGSYHIVYDYLKPCTRQEAYQADITYGTNSEFGFDYLRDHLAYDKHQLVQREHYYAIVDEIDSVLIDEARTPLIISAPIGKDESEYPLFAKIASTLKKDEDYEVDEKLKAVTLTDAGIEKAEKALGVSNIYTEKGIKQVHHLETATRAKALFEKDRDYVVRDGEIVIVDQFTGRLQPGRRWSEGLHQAIEAKEGVPIKDESRTFASISYQNYFKMYENLAGMTGTARTSAEEFEKVYSLETIEIPTNRPVARVDLDDLIFQTEQGKFSALTRRIKELHEEGRPVLVGTVSIEKNELLSEFFKHEGIRHEVLNAKNHEREGEIIADAGKKGGVVIATNMAGRGVDIKLGGANATKEEYQEIVKLGGLYVIGTERHEARRIDNQLRGRSGRQGDPGETQFFVSLEDSLMKAFASDRIKGMMGRFGIPEDEPIRNSFVTRAIESAQSKIEGFNFDARKRLLSFDNVLNQQRNAIYTRRQKVLTGDKEDLLDEINHIIEGAENTEEAKAVFDKKQKDLGEDEFYKLFRAVFLQSIDMLWVEHLEAMEYTRGSVNLRAYGQRDPLIEYKKEGLRMFRELENTLVVQILNILPNIGGTLPKQEEVKMKEVHERANALSERTANSTPRIVSHKKQEKIGRNDLCPCGSGKKYKKCGLLNTEEHQSLTQNK